MSILDVFPLRFCQTCWVEDEPVAIQAIEVSENVVNVIKHFQTLLCKSKQLSKNNLYGTFVTRHTVVFMKVKLQFFVDVTSMMSSYL